MSPGDYLNVKELFETRSVDQANRLLKTGWKLLTIVESRRGHIYILRTRTSLDALAVVLPLPN